MPRQNKRNIPINGLHYFRKRLSYAKKFSKIGSSFKIYPIFRKRFKESLLSLQGMEMEEQQSFFKYVLLNWRQDEPQMDDVLVMGVRI